MLDAGERLFCRQGFHGTNSKEIAGEAGVAIGSFYAYFRDKKALFLEVLDRYTEKILSSIPELPRREITRKQAEQLLADYLRSVIRSHDLPELHRELFVVMRTDPEVEVLIDRWQEEAVERIYQSFASVEPYLRIRDKKAAAVLLHAVVEAVIHRLTLYKVDIGEERLLAELTDMFCRYLLIDRE